MPGLELGFVYIILFLTLVQKRFLGKSIENVLLMGDRIFNQTKRHPKKRRTGLWYDTCFTFTGFPLYEKVEFRAITNSLGTLERAVIIFSVIPSLRNSRFGSSLMFTKGSTAIEGRSGKGKAIFWGRYRFR